MKSNFLYAFLVLFLFVQTVNIEAQESKSSLVFSGILSHYSRSGEFLDKPGFYKFPIDPGLEILYQFPVNKSVSLISGLSFQWAHFANYVQTVDRFRFGEIGIPIIIRKEILQKDKAKFYISSGMYGGIVSFLDWETLGKPEWEDVSTQYEEHYSKSDFYVDFYVDCGILYSLKNQNSISISPYFKYRIKENWMDYYRQSFFYGLKISYQLNILKNEI